jgi:hypothetical protein
MKEELRFLPFHAINEFMRDDFRLSVIRTVLSNITILDDKDRNQLYTLINKQVIIPGFRKPAKAPIPVMLIPVVKAFEKTPDLVAHLLAAWAKCHKSLRDEVYELLKVRNWSFIQNNFDIKDILDDWRILPLDADRKKLPGFYPIWPTGENFEFLYDTYTNMFPASEYDIDSVSLMVVWLAMRLPYQVESETDLEPDNQE